MTQSPERGIGRLPRLRIGVLSDAGLQRVLLLLVLLLLVLSFILDFYELKRIRQIHAESDVAAIVPPVPDPGDGAPIVPEFALLDDAGHPIGRQAWRGVWTVAIAGSATCGERCIVSLRMLRRALDMFAEQRRAADEPVVGPIRVVVVGIAPAGAPDALGELLSAAGIAAAVLVGPGSEAAELAEALFGGIDDGVLGSVAVIDPDLRIRAAFAAPVDSEVIAHRLALLWAP